MINISLQQELISFPQNCCWSCAFRLNTGKRREKLTWPNGLNNCLRSFSVASNATLRTSSFVELLSFSFFFVAWPSFFPWHSCKIKACPSRTVPYEHMGHLACCTSIWAYNAVKRGRGGCCLQILAHTGSSFNRVEFNESKSHGNILAILNMLLHLKTDKKGKVKQ